MISDQLVTTHVTSITLGVRDLQRALAFFEILAGKLIQDQKNKS